jgi:hypothetical protein
MRKRVIAIPARIFGLDMLEKVYSVDNSKRHLNPRDIRLICDLTANRSNRTSSRAIIRGYRKGARAWLSEVKRRNLDRSRTTELHLRESAI